MGISTQGSIRIAPPIVPPPVAGAVYFPNHGAASPAVVFTPAPLAIPDSPLLTVSMWARIRDGSINDRATLLFEFRPLSTSATCFFQVSWNFTYDIAVQVQRNGGGRLLASSYDGVFSANATGHHIFASCDTNHAAGAKLVNLYVDGINVLNPAYTTDLDAAFAIDFSANEFGVPTVKDPTTFPNEDVDLTEVWIACGQYVDPSQIGKFRDPITGKPVPLGAIGDVPTGIAPTYYLTGNAASFPTNKSGGPATSLAGVIQDGTFNTFVDQNPTTVFMADGLGGGYSGVFQDPMTVADSPFVTISIWVRLSLDPRFLNFPNLLSLGLNSGAGSGGNSVLLGGNTSGNQADVGCFFAALASPATNQVAFSSGGGLLTPNVAGHHIFISIDTNHAAGAKLLNIWIDGANAFDPAQRLDSGPAFNMSFARGGVGNFGIPDIDQFVGVAADLDFAEVWIACGQYLDPATNIGKFRNPSTGAPVNLGNSGELPTGTAPTFYLKGPSSTFYANYGSGGPVTQFNANDNLPDFHAAGAIGDSTWALVAPAPPVNTYVAQSVHFASSAGLSIAAIAAGTDNGFFSFSFWALNLIDGSNNGKTVFLFDPVNLVATFLVNSVPANQMEWQLQNVGATRVFNEGWQNHLRDPWFNTGVWNHFLGTAETNLTGATAKIMSLYVNDAPIKSDFYGADAIAFITPINGKQFKFANSPTFDVADLWVAPNVKLHAADGTIPYTTRRQFISPALQPVNPAGWPTSAVQCTGNASTFATNLGTGGAISVIGSLTNATTFPKVGGKFGAMPP